ncbi:MAG TPA: hypothetical protein PK101_10350, partial [Thauera sp.]|nr:hypothetical protein [Thauera sp.]
MVASENVIPNRQRAHARRHVGAAAAANEADEPSTAAREIDAAFAPAGAPTGRRRRGSVVA